MLDERFRSRLRGIVEASDVGHEPPSLDDDARARVLSVVRERGPALVQGKDLALDDHLQQRLGELADTQDPELDVDARGRVVQTVGEQGPGIVRRAQARRSAAYGAAFGLAVAAAVALFVQYRSGATNSSGVAVEVAESTATEPQAKTAALPSPSAKPKRACESWADRSAAEVGFRPNGGQNELDLGHVAFARALPNSRVYLEEATRCRTVIALGSGRVSVHARDLGGGELVVRTGDTEVRVRGTIFAVDRASTDVTVDVLEGRVVVRRAETKPVEVAAGRRLELDTELVAESHLDIVAEAHLLDEVMPLVPEALVSEALETPRPSAPRKEAPTGNAEDLLRRAEALRQAGDIAGARQLYQQVGSGSGPTAEAAWLALARMELANGNPAGARSATKQRSRRFGYGSLGPEALWISIRSHRQAGKRNAAERTARQLIQRWPDSPQAKAARRWLND